MSRSLNGTSQYLENSTNAIISAATYRPVRLVFRDNQVFDSRSPAASVGISVPSGVTQAVRNDWDWDGNYVYGAFSGAYIAGVALPRMKSLSWTPGSINSGRSATTTITVSGATLGNQVEAYCGASLGGLTLTGYVSATDTVTLLLSNVSAGDLTGPSTIYYVRVYRRDHPSSMTA